MRMHYFKWYFDDANPPVLFGNMDWVSIQKIMNDKRIIYISKSLPSGMCQKVLITGANLGVGGSVPITLYGTDGFGKEIVETKTVATGSLVALSDNVFRSLDYIKFGTVVSADNGTILITSDKRGHTPPFIPDLYTDSNIFTFALEKVVGTGSRVMRQYTFSNVVDRSGSQIVYVDANSDKISWIDFADGADVDENTLNKMVTALRFNVTDTIEFTGIIGQAGTV